MNNATDGAVIQSREDFDKTPREQYQYWQIELKASQKRLGEWHKQADKIARRYVDDRGGTADNRNAGSQFRLNLFNSNITTLISMLYGRLPKVDVSRTDKTGGDDAARVAAEMLERMLQLDMDSNNESYDAVLHATLFDRLTSGLGCARVRYEMEETVVGGGVAAVSEEGAVAMPMEEQTYLYENAPIDYYYWGDVLWGWGRTFAELPWIAFKSYLSKDEVQERFGDFAAENVKYSQQQVSESETDNNPEMASAWQKAEIWEIWDKTARKVCWVSLGCPKVLDTKDDPLQLTAFYPCPPFFLANQTTSIYKPTPDYHLAQDLYNEIDILQTRISILTEAVKCVGVYDASAEGIQRIFREGVENTLIPVDNWALFAEKGGIKGSIDWIPIQDIVNALDKLRGIRDETIGLLQQVTGMADIMRGDVNPYEGVGQSQIKAKFGSTRVQALQEQFAGFVSGLMQIKAEIITRHFDPQTIVKQSSILFTPDAEVVPEAMQVLKNPDESAFRVNIKPESLAQLDYSQLREERTGYLNGLSTFLQSATPLVQQDPRATPFLLEMLKWAMAGFKGAQEIEGVLDKAIEVMSSPEQQEQQTQPSPEEVRGKIQIQLEQIRQQAKQQEIQMSLQSDMQMREADRQADIQTEQARLQMEIAKIEAETQADLNKLSAKMEADVRTELLTSQINAEQAQAVAQAEIEKEIIRGRVEIEKLKLSKRADAGIHILDKQMVASEKREERAENRMDQMMDTGVGDDA